MTAYVTIGWYCADLSRRSRVWPFPCIFIGIALAGVAERVGAPLAYFVTALAAVLACGNPLNTNEYPADLIRNGAVNSWTDAAYRLAGAVSPYRSSQISIVDWGYLNGLRMIGRFSTASMTSCAAPRWRWAIRNRWSASCMIIGRGPSSTSRRWVGKPTTFRNRHDSKHCLLERQDE
jgi:hypothetical protein